MKTSRRPRQKNSYMADGEEIEKRAADFPAVSNTTTAIDTRKNEALGYHITEERPGRWIAGAVALGVVLALSLWTFLERTCAKYAPLDHWITFGKWWPQYVCKPFVDSPPWVLLTGLSAAPAVVLTWFLRTVQRTRDQRQKTIDQRQTDEQIRITSDSELTNRYAHSLEALMHHRGTPRLGAIYQLEQIALESPAYRERVVQALCGYLRSESNIAKELERRADEAEQSAGLIKGPDKEDTPRCAKHDVEAVLGVLSRMNPTMQKAHAPNCYRYPLSGVYFKDLRLTGLDLSHAEFDLATWKNCELNNCDLRDARFWHATLNKVILSSDCKLQEAHFNSTIFHEIRFDWADLSCADFAGSVFFLGRFLSVKMRGALINGVDLGKVTIAEAESADFNGARDDGNTRYPEGFDPVARGVEHINAAVARQRAQLRRGDPPDGQES